MKRFAPLLLVLAGCTSFNRFGDARTLEPGTSQHTVMADFWGASHEPDRDQDVLDLGSGVAPVPMPTYVFRHGLADRLELGIAATPFPSVGLDLKWNFLREGNLALALVPNVTGAAYLYGDDADENGWTAQASLPLLVSWRIGDDVALLPLVGLAYTRGAGSSDKDAWTHLAAGLGAAFQASPSVAVQPGVYVLQPLDADRDHRLYTAGLAFHFGSAEGR
jgi:hypothetical protein